MSILGDAIIGGGESALSILSKRDSQESVLDKDLVTSPGSPSDGDRHIIAGIGGLWSAFAINDVVEFNGANWDNFTPNEGWDTWVEDENIVYKFNGIVWVSSSSTLSHPLLSNLGTGSDHSFIDQDIKVAATPQFAKLGLGQAAGSRVLELTGITKFSSNSNVSNNFEFIALNTTANGLHLTNGIDTTGSLMFVQSSSTNTSARSIAKMENFNAAATGATVLKLVQNSSGLALDAGGNVFISGMVGVGINPVTEKLHIFETTGAVRLKIEIGDENRVEIRLKNSLADWCIRNAPNGDFAIRKDTLNFFTIDKAATKHGIQINNAQVEINPTSADLDFIVKTDLGVDAIKVDALLEQVLFGVKVGIDAPSPSATLEVGGNPGASVGGFASGTLHVTATSALINANSVITGHNSFGGNKQLWYFGSVSSSNDNIAFINRQNGSLSLNTNNAARVTIEAGGNVVLENQIQIKGGVPAAGKVLTSDAIGLAFWGAPSGWADDGAIVRLSNNSDQVGIGTATPLAKTHIDQSNSSGNIPVLTLDQADINDGFINFIGSDRGTGSLAGVNQTESVRVEINGVIRRIALYVDA